MKKLIFILLLFIGFAAEAQYNFPSLDSLRRYNNRFITNSAINAFTDYRLNTLLNGMIAWIDSAGGGASGVDSIWALNDSTIRYRKGLSLLNVTIKGGRDVDTIYRKLGQDSLFFKINGVERAVKDSTGGPAFVLYNALGGTGDTLVNADKEVKWLNVGYGIDRAATGTTVTHSADTSELATQFDLTQIAPTLTATQVAYGSGTNTITSESAFNYNAITDILSVPQVKYDTSWYIPKINRISGTSYKAFGDSYTEGAAATSIPDSAYVGYISRYVNLPLTNYGLSGRGAQTSIARHNANVTPLSNTFTSIFAGLNDVRRSGNNSKTYRKIVNSYKAAFANQYTKSITPTGGSGVTRYGTWGGVPWDATGDGGKSSSAAFTTTANDSLVYNFFDSTLIVGMIALQGAAYTATMYIDDVLVYTFDASNQTDNISDGGFDGSRTPYVLFFTGLSNGSHKFKLINASGGLMTTDYLGHFLPQASAATMLMYHTAKLPTAGYAEGSPTLNNASDAIIDSVNTKLDSMYATLPPGYPCFMIPVNDFTNTTTHMDADNIHRNNLGHKFMADGGIAQLGSASIPEAGKVWYAAGFLWLSDGTTFNKIPVGDVIYERGQFSGDTLKLGTTNNQPVSILSNNTTLATFSNASTNKLEMTGAIRVGDAGLALGEIQMRNTISSVAGTIAGMGRIGAMAGIFLNKDQFGGDPDNNVWRHNISGSSYNLQAMTDDLSAGVSFLSLIRNGFAVDSMQAHTRITYTGNFHASYSQFSLVDKKYVDSVVAALGGGGITSINSEIGPAFTIAASNGITGATTTNAFTTTLGGSLTGNTSIGSISDNFGLTVNRVGTSGATTLTAVSSTGNALNATTTSGTALIARSNSGLPGFFGSDNSATNSSVELFRFDVSTTGTAAANFGGHASFTTETSDGTQQESGRIGTIWTTATTGSRTSSMQFFTTNSASSAVRFTIKGSGQIQGSNYGSGTFTGTPTNVIASDASGNFIEATPTQISALPILQAIAADPTSFSATANSFTSLPVLSSNEVITLPSAASNAGRQIVFWNKNTSGNTWTFSAAITYPDGTTSTAFLNGTTKIIASDGSVWVQISSN